MFQQIVTENIKFRGGKKIAQSVQKRKFYIKQNNTYKKKTVIISYDGNTGYSYSSKTKKIKINCWNRFFFSIRICMMMLLVNSFTNLASRVPRSSLVDDYSYLCYNFSNKIAYLNTWNQWQKGLKFINKKT